MFESEIALKVESRVKEENVKKVLGILTSF